MLAITARMAGEDLSPKKETYEQQLVAGWAKIQNSVHHFVLCSERVQRGTTIVCSKGQKNFDTSFLIKDSNAYIKNRQEKVDVTISVDTLLAKLVEVKAQWICFEGFGFELKIKRVSLERALRSANLL